MVHGTMHGINDDELNDQCILFAFDFSLLMLCDYLLFQ